MNDEMKRMKRLLDVATLVAEKALAPVSKLQQAANETQGRIDQIAEHRARLMQYPTDPVQAALMAQQAERLRQQQARVLGELARQRAALETSKAAARTALGRKDVLEQIITKKAAK